MNSKSVGYKRVKYPILPLEFIYKLSTIYSVEHVGPKSRCFAHGRIQNQKYKYFAERAETENCCLQ